VSDKQTIDAFILHDELGIKVTPRCGGCKCGKCPQVGQDLSFLEAQELKVIQDGLTYKPEEKRWYCDYPWKVSPASMISNHNQAKMMLEKTVIRLKKDPVWAETYQ
jgi:hypothetical protein